MSGDSWEFEPALGADPIVTGACWERFPTSVSRLFGRPGVACDASCACALSFVTADATRHRRDGRHLCHGRQVSDCSVTCLTLHPGLQMRAMGPRNAS